MMRRLAVPFVLLLAACVPEVSDPLPPAPPPGPGGTCGAAELQGLVGQPAEVLQTMRFGTTVRMIRPGQAVTMDYSESRLNIDIDAGERIIRVHCG